ncbi:hypothetical protein [Janibacter alittae]|uniref:Uncharacterized protein n=1 Tax=Janibacter alittae TaxID=3115209 RepID=A0ABZ2MDL7_9MICO
MALSWALADGRIDPKENAQAHRRYADCMTESGYTPRFRESTDGLYVELPYLTVGDPARLDAAVRDCSVGTAMVSALYRIQLFNPRGLSDSRLVAVQCLAKEGLVSSTYSAEEFERNLIADKFPFDATAPEANDCLYGAGYAYFALDK